jgi:hypothetical protein
LQKESSDFSKLEFPETAFNLFLQQTTFYELTTTIQLVEINGFNNSGRQNSNLREVQKLFKNMEERKLIFEDRIKG